jgi:hypothetical protein
MMRARGRYWRRLTGCNVEGGERARFAAWEGDRKIDA